MKSLLSAFIAVSLCCSQQIAAQEKASPKDDSRDAKRKVVFGLKGGVNRSNVWDENTKNFVADRLSGYAFGGYMAIPIGSLLGFQPELMLEEKGFKGNGTLEGVSYSFARRTTHLDIPLQLMVKPFRWFTFLIGPNYSYMLDHHDVVNVAGNSTQTEEQLDGVNLRKNLFGTLVGIDLNFGHIVVSGRTGWDLTSNHGDGTSSAPRYKNRWLQATLGYRFY